MRKIIALFIAIATLASASERPAVITENVPAAIMMAEEAAPSARNNAQADAEHIHYFDKTGKHVENKTPGGYYRKILGIGDHQQRPIVQDFYQDSGTAFTSPVALVADADTTIFSPELFDSRVAWYRPDGSLLATNRFANGHAQLPYNFYHDGKLVAQLPIGDIQTGILLADTAEQPLITLQIFHANGKPAMRAYTRNTAKTDVHIYREDGTPLMRISDDKNNKHITAWAANGQPTTQKNIQKEYFPIFTRAQAIMRQLTRELDMIYHDADIDPPI